MINLDPSAVDALAESATELTSGISKNVPVIGNAAICADSLCTTGRAGINFYCSPNPVAKVFFGARGFNRLGKYTLHIGNVTSSNITNATAISDLMS